MSKTGVTVAGLSTLIEKYLRDTIPTAPFASGGSSFDYFASDEKAASFQLTVNNGHDTKIFTIQVIDNG